jgi:phosphatidylglycerophosphatase A
MAIKESSDELNPIAVTPDDVAPQSRAPRSAVDYLALALATCGVGYFPWVPGTWGSLLGVGLYLIIRWQVFGRFSNSNEFADPVVHLRFVVAELFVIAVASVVGVWAASRTERLSNIKDPGKIVIDEVAGQLIALLAVPLVVDRRWAVWLALAFLLFRFFDIVKPYPARALEKLKGGLGIMSDDLVAGVYAAVTTYVIIALVSRSF